MADQKITQLDAVVTPVDADLVPMVQDVATTPVTKKSTWTVLKAFLKTYFDTLYQPQSVRVVLSAVNIKAMYGAPVTVIAAPGAGKAIVVDETACYFTFNSVQYTGGGTVKLTYSGFSQALNSETFLDDNILKGVADQIRSSGSINACIVKENTAVVITNGTAAFADGDSTPVLFIKYRVITL